MNNAKEVYLGAGPATPEALKEVQDEIIRLNGLGLSVMEEAGRSP